MQYPSQGTGTAVLFLLHARCTFFGGIVGVVFNRMQWGRGSLLRWNSVQESSSVQEQESSKRREVETKLADAQRDCDTAYKARLVSEKQLDDVRCLAISLEEQLRDRSHVSQKESVLVRLLFSTEPFFTFFISCIHELQL